MRLRRLLLLGVPVVIVAGHTALWLWATGRLRTGLDAWSAERRAAGWSVDHGATTRGGWPLGASLIVADPALATVDGLAWRGERVVLRVGLARPEVLAIAPLGVQRLRIGHAPEIAAKASALTFEAPLNAPGPIVLLARDLRAGVGAEVATAGLVTGHLAPEAPQAGFALSAEAITLPGAERWVLGPHVSSVLVEGALAGNGADIAHLAVGWGPLGVSGAGHVAIDASGRPEGTATLDLVGADAALDAATAHGAITPSAAATVRAVLGLLAAAQGAGGQVRVPFNLQDGTLSAAGVPLARVPDGDWRPSR